MPSLYHFNSDQFKENLMLGGQQHMVAGRLCQYLKGWQLDGIRFLYKHFEKGEACILNDESGLGKVVTVSVFLGAILNNDTTKKCLIIVRDDDYIEGWRFHLSVLTQLTVKVIERTSDINYETVFLIKWSSLKNIGDITKVTFDHIIVDNRGEMLTNKFCTGILLRYFENKTSIVISSADITADIKLLHILLRLCGRLEKQYTDVKLFEEKFQLPKLKDGVCSKIDLEDYFLKRERVINFCREFRLRRYCHQFDEEFPLVPSNEFKRHLQQWRSSDNSQSSGSVKLLSSSSEKDIEELFQAYFQVKEERGTRKLDCEVQKITENMRIIEEDLDVSDELVIMSPLLLVSESESDSEQTQVQIQISSKFPEEEEVKEEEGQQEMVDDTQQNQDRPPISNRRKSTMPVKILTRNKEELIKNTNLRSRKVPSSESPSREKYLKVAQKIIDKDVKIPKKRGRKPLVKIMKDEGTIRRHKDEVSSRQEKGDEKEDEKKKAEEKVESKTSKKDHEKEKNKLNKLEEDNKNTKDEIKKKPDKLVKDKEISKEKEEILKKSQAKLVAEKNKVKENEKKNLDKIKKKPREEEVIEEKKPTKLDKRRKHAIEENKQEDKKKQAKLDEVKKQSKVEEKISKKTPAKKFEEDTKRPIEEKKKQAKPQEIKSRFPEDEFIAKKTPSKLEEKIKRTIDEDKDKDKKKQDKKKAKESEPKESIKKTRDEPEKEKETVAEDEKQKKRQSKPQERTPKNIHTLDKSKEAKEEENKKRRAVEHDATIRNGSNKKVKRKYRNVNLDLVLFEANKFMNNKHIGRKSTEGIRPARRTKTPDKSKASAISPNRAISSPKTPATLRKPPDVSKPPDNHKDKTDTPKRGRPLTVYTPLGVHSKSTRGMERCTRSCPIQNKYMKVAVAQVDIDKTRHIRSDAKRLLKRRRAVAVPKKTSPAVESKLPPLPPTPLPFTESSVVLESMQLGQALTPTNVPLSADFIAPPTKKVDYNFPLMLDKDIPDTECIITSQISANNEIIILTGSSTNDHEMEPPKSTVSRRKTTMKPPMVTIPRPSFNKAKSPDLFSTFGDLSLPCSQQQNSKSNFEGFKIFGSELRQSSKQRSCLDILERILEPRSTFVAENKSSPPKEKSSSSPQQHCIEDEDAMFEITANGTFGNIVRVNSNGEMSPIRNKGQSTPPSASHPKNRITNYLISSNQHTSGAPPSSSLEDSADLLPKTPKRRKSLSGTMKRSPRAFNGGIAAGKSQSTKLTQWLVKNSVDRISEIPQKPLATKRRRLDLSFPDD